MFEMERSQPYKRFLRSLRSVEMTNYNVMSITYIVMSPSRSVKRSVVETSRSYKRSLGFALREGGMTSAPKGKVFPLGIPFCQAVRDARKAMLLLVEPSAS